MAKFDIQEVYKNIKKNKLWIIVKTFVTFYYVWFVIFYIGLFPALFEQFIFSVMGLVTIVFMWKDTQ